MDQHQILLTLTQSLHLAALAPCVLVIFYLLATTQHPLLITIPLLFFASLGAGLFAPLTHSFFLTETSWLNVQYLTDLLLPTLSFLLITQFFLNRFPPLYYCLLIFVPFIIAFPALQGLWSERNVCLSIDICVESISLMKIAFVVTGALVMMLITVTLSRFSLQLDLSPYQRAHKYWLIIAIICLNLCLMALELTSAADFIESYNYMLIKVILKMAFIYLVLVSIFQVYAEAFAVDQAFSVSYHSRPLKEHEKVLAIKIIKQLESEKPYLEIGFNRQALAEQLKISEHQLSRVVNLRFHKTISELLNEYRIDAAKQRLSNTDEPITNIAFDVGFNSIASFNRVFKQFSSCSPSQYREQYKI